MKGKFRIIASGFVLGLSSHVAAQDTRSIDSLEETVVEADALSLTAQSLEEDKEMMNAVAGGTNVIAVEEVKKGRVSTLQDTFRLAPGVVALPRFGSDEARLSIRGSGLQRNFHGRGLELLQDGVPLNLADGQFDMAALELSAADHINVWRGANALRYGSTTLGGAIDYISRNGLNSPGGLFRTELGSWNYQRSTVALGGSRESIDGFFSFSSSRQDGFRRHAQQKNQRFFGNFGWQISDRLENRTYLTAAFARSQLPGNLTKAELRRSPRMADGSMFGALNYGNRRDLDLLRLANKTTYRGGNHRFDLITAFTYGDLDHPITPFVGVIDQITKDAIIGTNYQYEGEIFGRKNTFTLGYRYQHGTIHDSRYQTLLGGRRGNLTQRLRQTAANSAIYLEDSIELGAGVSAVLGYVWNHDRRDQQSRLGGAGNFSRKFTHHSPKAGLRYEGDGYQVYANVSGSYEPPIFDTTSSAQKAQRATSFELGTRGTYNFIGWDATVYHANVRGEYLELNDINGVPQGIINAGKTIHEGFELGFRIDLLGNDLEDKAVANQLFWRTVWNYNRFKFRDDAAFGNNTIAGLPPHLIYSELQWENEAGYYFGPTLTWVPQKAWVDHANTLSADSYALLGIKLGQRREQGLSWFVELHNLTDQKYAITTDAIADAGGADARVFAPGDGRSIFAGVEWTW